MVGEEMLDPVREEDPYIASYARIFIRRMDSKDKAKSISYFLYVP